MFLRPRRVEDSSKSKGKVEDNRVPNSERNGTLA